MGRSKAKQLEMLNISNKIKQLDLTPPVYLRNLALLLNISRSLCLNVLRLYNLDYLLGSKDDQDLFIHNLRSAKALNREKELKESGRKAEISLRGAESYKKRYQQKKLENPNCWYDANRKISPEVEVERRRKISETENNRTEDEWKKIINKRKKTMSSRDYTNSRLKQSQKIKETLSKYTPEQWKEKGLKISIGRKLAYSVESPEHKLETFRKISDTCLKRYGVKWYTLSDEIHEKNNCVSKINKNIAKKLEEKGIEFSQEYRLNNYSYDFKIGNYLIEIDPTVTHNLDWCPFGNSKILPVDYHRKKSLNAINNKFICVHIFDWMNFDYYLGLILSGDLKVRDKGEIRIYNYDSKNKKLEEVETESTVRIADDGFEIY